MADVINKRDKLLQEAETRVIVVPPPEPIIIEGFTGVEILKDGQMFVISASGQFSCWVTGGSSRDRLILTAKLKGIPNSTPVTWRTGGLKYLTDPVDNHIIGSEFDPTISSTIILTETGDPLVRTIEVSNYPRPNTTAFSWGTIPNGYIEVSVPFGSRTFKALTAVFTFTG